jgi:serine/threonine protein phosphatase 1
MTGESKSNHNRIFAIGDVHGCAVELEALLRKLQVRKDDLVVFLGDYVDRGSESRRVVDIILELSTHCDVIALKGNHEAMLLDFLERPESPGAGLFVLNGGASTLANYEGPGGSFEFPNEHINFFRTLRLYYETDQYFFVHAGVPNQPLSLIDEVKDEMTMLWSRQPFLSSTYKWEKIVVHGHTPVDMVDVKANRINLDTGCVYDGKLTALELPARKFHSVEKGTKAEAPVFPKEFSSSRVSMRFVGQLPVEARRGIEPTRRYETLNYNQFGLLMKDVEVGRVPYLRQGDLIEGVIGATDNSGVEFAGEVVRTESRGQSVVYGIRIDRISRGAGSPQTIERPTG